MRKIILATATSILLAATPALAGEGSQNALAIGTELGSTPEAITAALTGMGWEVRRLEMDGGIVETYAVKGNQTAVIFVDPATGQVVKGGEND